MARLTAEKWDEVKALWAVGKRTLEDIGEEFGVSHGAISQRAKKEGWERISSTIIDSAIESRAKLTKLTETNKIVSSHLGAEIDRLADLKLRLEENALEIANSLPRLLKSAGTMQELQQASVAHKNLYDTHFKTVADTQVNIQNNLPSISVTFDG